MGSPFDVNAVTIYPTGPSAVVAALCDALKIPQIIDSVVRWDPVQCRLSPGLRVKAMLINVLVRRSALWRVERFFEHQDLEVLFGTSQQVEAHELNDDALGRALDKLAEVDLKLLFSSIALQAAMTNDIPLSHLHCDTTSISVQGAYEEEGELHITFGYSKDKRPDLKQFLVGLTVTKEGIPVFGQLLDGNRNDKTWYPEVIDQMVASFAAKDLQKTIFVADSALVTKDNLDMMAEKEIRFISRLPETFSIAEELKDLAWAQDTWTHVGALSKKKDAAQYKACSFEREVNGYRYRLIVVHSTSLDQRKEKSLLNKWQKEKEELEAKAQELFKNPFACTADAEKAIALFLADHKKASYHLTGVVESETIQKHARRGRPKLGETPATQIVYHAKITVGAAKTEIMDDIKKRAATFVLITNLLDPKAHTDADILREYKEQNTVEEQFRFLKSPFLLGQVYVKKNSRVLALGFIFQLVLLMASYLRYRVKKSIEQEGKPLLTPQKQKLDHPTVRVILDMLDELMVVRVGNDRGIINRPRPEVLRLIRLAGFTETIYLLPPG